MWFFVATYILAVLLIENDIRWNWSKYKRMAKWEMLVMQFCPVINVIAVGMITKYR